MILSIFDQKKKFLFTLSMVVLSFFFIVAIIQQSHAKSRELPSNFYKVYGDLAETRYDVYTHWYPEKNWGKYLMERYTNVLQSTIDLARDELSQNLASIILDSGPNYIEAWEQMGYEIMGVAVTTSYKRWQDHRSESWEKLLDGVEEEKEAWRNHSLVGVLRAIEDEIEAIDTLLYEDYSNLWVLRQSFVYAPNSKATRYAKGVLGTLEEDRDYLKTIKGIFSLEFKPGANLVGVNRRVTLEELKSAGIDVTYFRGFSKEEPFVTWDPVRREWIETATMIPGKGYWVPIDPTGEGGTYYL